LKINEVSNLVTFVLFHKMCFKTIKGLRQSVCYDLMRQSAGIGRATSEMIRAPLMGLQVILPTGTDLAQPIRVLQDSWAKG
jgi:hypothetical protein